MRKVLLALVAFVALSGCYVAPLAFFGPATSGFSTASLIQSGVTTGANYMVKQGTGKTIGEHAIEAINDQTLKQTYFPENENISKRNTTKLDLVF